ncbi:hypothetical protein C942_00493 [Photobacterium marinum]|uniref:Uncharacterized protein n=1 Tax=Photobacterium marinum TaxID=1056511 RepID=L8JB65_9GAMM|nr:hypothetical protein C942_00493 [Photobacterium marinum]
MIPVQQLNEVLFEYKDQFVFILIDDECNITFMDFLTGETLPTHNEEGEPLPIISEYLHYVLDFVKQQSTQ